MIIILTFAAAVVAAMLYLARGIAAAVCECPYDCPNHPTVGSPD